jgi:HSP20 family molecular chaperone IbpA
MDRSVEEAIERAKTVYQWVTGQPPPEVNDETPYARIPPEVDREEHVLRQAATLLERVQELTLSAGYPVRPGVLPARPVPGWTPAWASALPAPFTVVRGQDDLRYVFDLAGVPRDRISVELQGSTLRISGERPQLTSDRGDQSIGQGSIGTRLERLVQLPIPVEPSALAATFKDGLLTVRVRIPVVDDKIHKIEVR